MRILLESGSAILLEDGADLLLESGEVVSFRNVDGDGDVLHMFDNNTGGSRID